jgi:N-acetylneuraminic acid mutarotase
MHCNRRAFLASGFALLPLASAFAQSGSGHHGGLYERLQQPGRIDKPETAAAQHVFDSPAPRAANPGRWMTKAPLPLPRSEMAWATAHAGRLHLVGGYAEQRVDRPYHHVYDPASDSWTAAAPLPRGANHVGVAVLDGRLYAIGGLADRWAPRAPLPTGRDRIGALAVGTLMHVIGGRVDSFHTNSNLHHIYDPARDTWERRNPLPTARSGHGAVYYRDKIFVLGGEGTNRVFGQNEAYDPQQDAWEHYAPMPTPRHGLGAVVIGDAIYVVGGGPVMGGGVQSAVHEAFTLG